jgi:hypothetical protein
VNEDRQAGAAMRPTRSSRRPGRACLSPTSFSGMIAGDGPHPVRAWVLVVVRAISRDSDIVGEMGADPAGECGLATLAESESISRRRTMHVPHRRISADRL